MVELELRRYAKVLPFVGLKSYRHYFLSDCHTDMENQLNYCVLVCFLGAKYAKNAFVSAYSIPIDPLAGLKVPTSKGREEYEENGRRGKAKEGGGMRKGTRKEMKGREEKREGKRSYRYFFSQV